MPPADATPASVGAAEATLPAPCTALIILDGWGLAPAGAGNAVSLASTPVFDELWERYPHTQLTACGRAVGLPAGQMGNSEVGHLNLGAGSVVMQDLTRIDHATEHGELGSNTVISNALAAAERVHLIGLVSDGGVHSGFAHLEALIRLAAERGVPDLVLHALEKFGDDGYSGFLTFNRFHQRAFFSADVAAGADKHFEIEAEFTAKNFLAEQARVIATADFFAKGFFLLCVFMADVEDAALSSRNKAGDEHAFDDKVRQMSHDKAVFDRARFAFVGIANDVFHGIGLLAQQSQGGQQEGSAGDVSGQRAGVRPDLAAAVSAADAGAVSDYVGVPESLLAVR